MSSHKPQKFNKNKGDRPPKPPGVGKRIRDIERLLKSRGDTLPAEVKDAKEKELEGLRGQLKDKQQQVRANKFTAKYKMVRFLERKRVMKIEARLNKAIKALEGKDQRTEEEKQQLTTLKEDLKKAGDDMAYVMHFPAHLKYISLFPKTPMTNERILKLQASIREDLMKKKAAGELKDKDATMDVTEEFPDENGTQGDKPAKPTPAPATTNAARAKTAKSDNPVTKSTTAKQAPKEQKPKGSFQRPEDAAEKAPKKPAKKEKDSFFMGDDEKEVAKKDNKKTDVKEDKKKVDKMQVEPKKQEKVVKKKKDSDESDDSSSSSEDKSDNENQEYVKGGKSSSKDSSEDSSEDSASEEKQPANKKRKASAADLETNKHKNKKQKK